MPRQSRRFSIFDAMEEKGVFEANPANYYSRDAENTNLYKGPVEYPKMFYHPEGKERVLNPGSTELINGVYTKVGLLMEVEWTIANNSAEEKKLRSEGWHDHPAKAIAASGKEAPAISSGARISELQAKMAEMQAELDAAKAVGGAKAVGNIKKQVEGTAKDLGVA